MDYDKHTALIVVDVQNDFADPAGNLYVADGEHTIPRINEEVAAAIEAGATVVYTQDWHPESTPHFQKDGGIWPVHCVAGSWGAAFHPDLAVAEGAAHVRKGVDGEDGYSGFTIRDPMSGTESGTGLEGRLRAAGIERTVVVGLALDYCVKETALDANRLGFPTTVIMDATRSVNLSPDDGNLAVAQLAAAGVLTT